LSRGFWETLHLAPAQLAQLLAAVDHAVIQIGLQVPLQTELATFSLDELQRFYGATTFTSVDLDAALGLGGGSIFPLTGLAWDSVAILAASLAETNGASTDPQLSHFLCPTIVVILIPPLCFPSLLASLLASLPLFVCLAVI